MEVAGLAFGVASLFASFKGALDGYAFLAQVWDGFSDSSFYSLKLRIERDRLRAWGDLYGLHAPPGKITSRLEAEPEATRRLVQDTLVEIRAATMDVEELASRYGLQVVGPDTALRTGVSALAGTVAQRADVQKEVNSRLSKRKRFTVSGMLWVLKDEERLDDLLKRLVYLNDSLEQLCPRDEARLLALGLSSYVLPSVNQPSNLTTIEESSKDLLAYCALMKRLYITSEASIIAPVHYETLQQITGVGDATGARQTATTLTPDGIERDILIEWKSISSTLTSNQRKDAIARVKRLCGLLSGQKPTPFSLLSCVGLIDDLPAPANGDDEKLGIVFAFPTQDAKLPLTLSQVIKESTRTAPLGDRFALARALASAVLLIHSARWLHKSLRSDNILFFPELVSGQTPLNSPFVGGFDYARPLQAESIDKPKQAVGYIDMYRHPEWTAGFSRLCDIYSLGVLLFEIALWKPIQKYREDTEEKVRDKLLHNAPLLLPGIMGERYSEVVRLCLAGDFGVSPNSENLDRLFWLRVVKELSSCRV
ncbi:prion-inhibition and propagation-domain-containing protein [Apiosordaria backusii]|uniref:Prion-inhibition and propagation-domain-containing protein n=1 Tax=Apiosordaria backusii TaxID=314023 RepID=A0AA39ZPY1_9PEZI|nr:prion-inhibition and propagation-domain-containing protein [Apiosordaria backusii]